MPLHRSPALLLIAALFAAPVQAQSGGSLLIWPLNPTIKAQENAAALWLENPSDQPITMQIQSYAWAQQDGEDVYAPQNEVIATPTLVTLAPKAKQLIRLTRLGPPPSQPERAYRLIVDEVPVERSADTAQNMATGIQFRMRYSLPLFTYAPGMLPPSDASNNAASSKNSGNSKGQYPTPMLAWHLAQDGKQRVIEIDNRGLGHARLTSAKIIGGSGGSGETELASGLMGYVLAGSRLRYPLPASLDDDDSALQFIASVNSAPPTPLPKQTP
jgi:fimbrial chaperone protein